MVIHRTRLTSMAVLTLVVLASRHSPAPAHSSPERFVPAPDATLRSAPAEVRVLFDGDLEPAFSTIQVTDSGGRRVDKGTARVDERNRRLLRITLGVLGPGVYRVRWQILAVDGHRNEGTYLFTVKPSE